MKCEHARDLLSAYHDGELRGSWRNRLEQHLGNCHGCRETRADIERVSDAFTALRETNAPATLRARVLENAPCPAPRPAWLPRVGAAAAGAVVYLVAAWGVDTAAREEPSLARHLHEAAAYLAQPDLPLSTATPWMNPPEMQLLAMLRQSEHTPTEEKDR